MVERPIISRLGRSGKAAPRQLAHVQVVTNAFAAGTLARAGFVGAIAILHVEVFVTIHTPPLGVFEKYPHSVRPVSFFSNNAAATAPLGEEKSEIRISKFETKR
jgi:hypothetical protein